MVATRQYYWIVAHDDTGKPYLIYGGESEEAARDKGLEMLSGIDFSKHDVTPAHEFADSFGRKIIRKVRTVLWPAGTSLL